MCVAGVMAEAPPDSNLMVRCRVCGLTGDIYKVPGCGASAEYCAMPTHMLMQVRDSIHTNHTITIRHYVRKCVLDLA